MHDRSSRGESYWRTALQRQVRSGQSILSFCDEEGVSAGTFYKWRRRLAAEASPPFAELCLADRSITPSLEIELPDQTIVRISGTADANQLATVLHCLRAESC